MGCACSKNRATRVNPGHAAQARTASSSPQPQAVTAAAKVWYEVWKNGRFTGRRSDSLVSAQTMATRLGGEVRPSSTA